MSDIALTELGVHPRGVVVLAGAGGNGGGGLSAARHLHNRGVDVAVVLDREAEALGTAARHQLDVLLHSGIEVTSQARAAEEHILGADLVLDALVGYSLRGRLRGQAEALVELADRCARAVVSLDVPTGLDATTGAAEGALMRPVATVTLALPKTGLAGRVSATGRVYLADIGIPPEVFEAVGIRFPEDPYTARGWTALTPTGGRLREGGLGER